LGINRYLKKQCILQAIGGKPEIKYNKQLLTHTLQNEPMTRIIKVLITQIPNMPLRPIIVNETHYSGNVDLDLKVSDIHHASIAALRKALKPYGLDLIPVNAISRCLY
jgi:orotidine-5'-phosphate decarboxylase